MDAGILPRIPILDCYGLHHGPRPGGGGIAAAKWEYGFAELNSRPAAGVLAGVEKTTRCWMSHGDTIGKLPQGFRTTAATPNTPVAAAEDAGRRFYGLQFHPEVVHTPEGKKILGNFLFAVCNCKKNWTMKSFARDAVAEIRQQVGNGKVILGLSGGVDSSAAAVLSIRPSANS